MSRRLTPPVPIRPRPRAWAVQIQAVDVGEGDLP